MFDSTRKALESRDLISIGGVLMKVEDFEKLVDYVADLRSKLQHARTRSYMMDHHLELLSLSDAPAVEVLLWCDAMDDHAQFIDNLQVQLGEYETLLGWPLTTEAQ